MRVLLDECLPRRLALGLSGHDAVTVQQMGWSGISNGRLLDLARSRFDVLVTVDTNLVNQQRLSALSRVNFVWWAASPVL